MKQQEPHVQLQITQFENTCFQTDVFMLATYLEKHFQDKFYDRLK